MRRRGWRGPPTKATALAVWCGLWALGSKLFRHGFEFGSHAAIALAWLLAQKPWIAAIPGTTQMAHMLENAGSAQIRFTAAELAEFTTSLNAIAVRGARLPDAVLAYSEVEAPERAK